LGDLRVAITWQIGIQVMLDLVAEVSGHERQYRPGVEVRGSQHLPQIPFWLGFAHQSLWSEFLCTVREVPADDDRIRPHIAYHVAARFAVSVRSRRRELSVGKENVVLKPSG